jgi:hypothetical protein
MARRDGSGRGLPMYEERTAVSARWPDDVLALSDDERARRVRVGQDSVLLDDPQAPKDARTRGFVKSVLTVPLGHEAATVYGVFVEVDRAAYQELQKAYREKRPARVRGRLATRLPHLEAAFGAEVEIVEDGSEKRPRIVAARHQLIVDGPGVGPAR